LPVARAKLAVAFGKKRGGSKVAKSDYNVLLIHVAYLRDLAERLGGTDKEAVLPLPHSSMSSASISKPVC
jgi:hypothetical protein